MKRVVGVKSGSGKHKRQNIVTRPGPVRSIVDYSSSSSDDDDETTHSENSHTLSDDLVIEQNDVISRSEEPEEKLELTKTIVMFPNKKLDMHHNVVRGKFYSKLNVKNGPYVKNIPCVIKYDLNSDKISAEGRVLQKLGVHSNIVTLYDTGTIQTAFFDISYLALERCHDLNLEAYMLSKDSVPVYDVNRGLKFCRQLIRGVKFLHENLIIHKDLKPSNILLTHDLENVKIADLGSSEVVKSSSSKVRCPFLFGTLGYRPPESLDRSYASLKSDIFSLGVLFCYLLTCGKSPFGPESDRWDHNTQKAKIVLPHLLVPNPVATKHLIMSMLVKDRCRRPPIHKIECHPCWSGEDGLQDFCYAYEEEVDDSDVVEDISSGEKMGDESEDEFPKALRSIPETLLLPKPGNILGASHSVEDAEHYAIINIIRMRFENVLPNELNKLGTVLIDAMKMLMNDQADKGVKTVRAIIPDTLSADDVNMIGKKIDEEHPVCAIIMHRVSGSMYKPHNVTSHDTVSWIARRVSDISRIAEQILKSVPPKESDVVIKACLKFMEELLHDLRAVKHAKIKDKTILNEVGCILSISRIHLDATKHFKTPLNPSIINLCLDGLARLESGKTTIQDKFYGYILNNIGETYLQLRQFEIAERYLKKALEVKKEFSYRSEDKKIQDVKITQKNIEELERLKSQS